MLAKKSRIIFLSNFNHVFNRRSLSNRYSSVFKRFTAAAFWQHVQSSQPAIWFNSTLKTCCKYFLETGAIEGLFLAKLLKPYSCRLRDLPEWVFAGCCCRVVANWLQRGVLHRNRPSASKQINHKEVLGVTNNQQPHTSWSGNTHFFLITAYYQVSLQTIIDWGPNQPIIKVLKFYGQNWNPWKRNEGILILYQVQSQSDYITGLSQATPQPHVARLLTSMLAGLEKKSITNVMNIKMGEKKLSLFMILQNNQSVVKEKILILI